MTKIAVIVSDTVTRCHTDVSSVEAYVAKYGDADTVEAVADNVQRGWTRSGGSWAAPQQQVDPRADMVCSPMQMRLALAAAGMLDAVNAAAASNTSAQIAWEYGIAVERNSPFISSLAAGFTNPNTGQTITDEEIDALFTAAMAI